MKPRRCAHHVYSTRSPISWANSSAILFSKPSPRWFENGRLFGSAQTRKTPAGLGITGAVAIACVAGGAWREQAARNIKPIKNKTGFRTREPGNHRLRKREDIQHASLRRVCRQIRHRADETQRPRRIARI